MPTNAKYMTIIGDNRIVSLQNGAGVDVPKTLEYDLFAGWGAGTTGEGDDQPGNRQIAIMMLLAPIWQEKKEPVYEDDDSYILRVRVPQGIIAAPGIQRFVANTPLQATDTPRKAFFPQAYVIPQNATCRAVGLAATPIVASADQANQTLDIGITQFNVEPVQPKQGPSYLNYLLFLVKVDWSHTIIN